MKITARTQAYNPKKIDILVDGRPIKELRCIEGSARLSGGCIEATFVARIPLEVHQTSPAPGFPKKTEKKKEEVKSEDTVVTD